MYIPDELTRPQKFYQLHSFTCDASALSVLDSTQVESKLHDTGVINAPVPLQGLRVVDRPEAWAFLLYAKILGAGLEYYSCLVLIFR